MPGSARNRYYRFLIYLAVVILLNIAGITLFFRVDLTSSKVYSLSEASRDAVATLSEPLTVKVFFNSNLPAPYNNIERYLHDLLTEYAIAGGRHFNYRFYNVSVEDDEESRKNQVMAEDFGIQPVQIQNIEQDEVKFQRAYMGMVMLHGDIIEAIPTITSTEGLEYQITSSILKMNNKISALLRLEDNISVKFFLSSSLRAVGPYLNIPGIESLPERIKDIVSKLNNKNYGKLSFTHLDPTLNPDLEKEAELYNILRLNWDEFRDRDGHTIPADRGYAGIIVEHGDRFEEIKIIEVIRLPIFGTQYQLADMTELEGAVNETIESVIDINEEIGYLADHGTISASQGMAMFGAQQQDSISSLNKLIAEEYSIKPVNLREGSIPDGLSFLIIAGPKENFADYELYQIDQFLMKGKNLAVFLDPFNEIRPQAQQGMMGQSFHVAVNTGLEKLLHHYGLDISNSLVLDENSFEQRVPQAFGGGESKIFFAPIIKNENINKEAEYLENIKGLVMLKASPVTVDEKRMEEYGLKYARLFSSSERSWEMKERINLNPMAIHLPEDEAKFRSYPLAYMVEGQFPSYFAGKPVPFKKEEKPEAAAGVSEELKKDGEVDMSDIATEGTTINKGRPGKIFLIGTSEIIKDSVIDAEGKTPNAQFAMNVIDYLNGREDIAVMRSKTQKFNPLKEVTPGVRTAIKMANIAGLPVLIVIIGLAVWGRRSARKRMIQKLFANSKNS